MAAPVVKFNTYTFTNIGVFNPHFTKQLLSTVKMSGHVGGGFDNFGWSRGPTEEHTLLLDFALVVYDRDNLQAAINSVTALSELGQAALFYTPAGASTAWFCYARAADIDVSQDFKSAQLLLRGRITFVVAEPRWYKNSTTSVAQACSGVATTWTLTYANGNAIAIPVSVTVACASGQTVENPVVQNLDDGAVILDELEYIGTIAASKSFAVYPQARRVLYDSAAAYSSFDALYADWFRLYPGDNNLKLIADNVGDACTVTIVYRETYR